MYICWQRYVPPEVKPESGDSTSGPTMTVISEEAEDETVEEQAEAASEADTNQECKYIECEGIKITFLPLNSLPDMAKKS